MLKADGAVTIDCADSYTGTGVWTNYVGNVFTAFRSATAMNPPETAVWDGEDRLTYVAGNDYQNLDEGEWGYDSFAQTLFLHVVGGEDPGTHQIFVADLNRPNGISVTNSDYITVEGITVLHAYTSGISVLGAVGARLNGVTIKNTTAAHCRRQGIALEEVANALVTGNTAHHNQRNGIQLANSDNCAISRNHSYMNDRLDQPRGGAAGIKIGNSNLSKLLVTDVIVDYNIVHDNEDTGIDILGATRVAVRRNVSYRNQDHGYDTNTAQQVSYINNVAVRNDHDGISVENSAENVEIFNCALVHNAVYGGNLGILGLTPGPVRELFLDNVTGAISNHNIIVGLTPGTHASPNGNWTRRLTDLPSTYPDAGHGNGNYWSLAEHQSKTAQFGSALDAQSYSSVPPFRDSTGGHFSIEDDSENDNLVDAAKSDVTGWLTPMWLLLDPAGIGPHNTTKSNSGSGTPPYSDIGAFEYDPRPGPTTTLSTACEEDNAGHWRLMWPEAWEDSVSNGIANAYEVKYSATTITEENWGNATSIGGPDPAVGGDPYWWIAVPETRHVAIKSKDANGQWSALSNEFAIDPAVYGNCNNHWYGGGGGGGCCHEDPLRGPSTSSLRRALDSFGASENTILIGTPIGTRGADLLPIAAVQNDEGQYVANLRVTGRHGTLVDGVKLLFVDHPNGTETFACGATAVTGRRIQANRAVSETGADVTKLVNGTGGIFNAAAAVAVTVSTPLDSLETPLVIECANGGATGHGIIVESQSPSGWQEVGTVYPRRLPSATVIEAVPPGPVRLRFTGYAHVRSVARLARWAADVTSAWGTLVGAQSSSAGEVLSAVGVEDTIATALVGPDTLVAIFSGPQPGQDVVRDVFLGISATPVTASAATSFAASHRSSLPTQFALYQNAPNPFWGSTTIRLDLPVGRMVKLEIFDVTGRRVRTLVDRFMPAGRQSVVWNQRDDAGTTLGAGVYFTRLQVGTFRDRKKVVLMP